MSLVAVAYWLARNATANLAVRRTSFGFDFLFRPANIPIGETLIDYEPGQPIYMAILAGLLNTVLVSAIGIMLATMLGTALGVARMSRNTLASSLAGTYVEFVRNVPLLAHLFLIYAALQGLPPLRSALSVGDVVFLSNRGLVMPAISVKHAMLPLLLAVVTAIGAWLLMGRSSLIGVDFRLRPAVLVLWCLGIGIATFLAVLFATGGSLRVSLPHLQGLNFSDGQTLSPELTALVLGLTIYYSAFIAEIVRAGILAVPKGQVEAATALGLRSRQILRLVVLPQALRVIIPPTTSQYLDLAKTSSLAIAIGYPDVVVIINSVITDTGRAIECVALIIVAFLAINLSISAAMNVLNSRTRIVQR